VRNAHEALRLRLPAIRRLLQLEPAARIPQECPGRGPILRQRHRHLSQAVQGPPPTNETGLAIERDCFITIEALRPLADAVHPLGRIAQAQVQPQPTRPWRQRQRVAQAAVAAPLVRHEPVHRRQMLRTVAERCRYAQAKQPDASQIPPSTAGQAHPSGYRAPATRRSHLPTDINAWSRSAPRSPGSDRSGEPALRTASPPRPAHPALPSRRTSSARPASRPPAAAADSAAASAGSPRPAVLPPAHVHLR